MYTAFRSNKSTPASSVDERVPSLPTTPPAAQLQHTLKTPPLGHTTALNPSSNRFTLSIPLLGRPKAPLESVLGKEKEEEKEKSMFGLVLIVLIHSCFRWCSDVDIISFGRFGFCVSDYGEHCGHD